jgi:hypothetical protein
MNSRRFIFVFNLGRLAVAGHVLASLNRFRQALATKIVLLAGSVASTPSLWVV